MAVRARPRPDKSPMVFSMGPRAGGRPIETEKETRWIMEEQERETDLAGDAGAGRRGSKGGHKYSCRFPRAYKYNVCININETRGPIDRSYLGAGSISPLCVSVRVASSCRQNGPVGQDG